STRSVRYVCDISLLIVRDEAVHACRRHLRRADPDRSTVPLVAPGTRPPRLNLYRSELLHARLQRGVDGEHRVRPRSDGALTKCLATDRRDVDEIVAGALLEDDLIAA